jgi:hypothetical protein
MESSYAIFCTILKIISSEYVTHLEVFECYPQEQGRWARFMVLHAFLSPAQDTLLSGAL